MPGKFQEGFTKAAQKVKFIRHRDIKLKEKEIKKERIIQKGMCEGICSKCREKVQWRFKYDKYKPLKHPAKCADCKNKTVNKAYRTLCDNCASKRKVCSSCCLSYEEVEAARLKLQQENSLNNDNNQTESMEMENNDLSEDENDEEEGDDDDDDVDGEDDVDDVMDDEDDNNNNNNEIDDIKNEKVTTENDDDTEQLSSVFTRPNFHLQIGNDERIKDKYANILETKYSKNRVIEKDSGKDPI